MDNYVDAVREYLLRYHELSQYIVNIKQDIGDCEAFLKQEAAPSSFALNPTGGRGGGEKASQEEQIYMQKEELQEKLRGYYTELQKIEPFIKRLNRSMQALASINETDATILRDRYIDGMSWENTAHHTCSSVGFCRKRAKVGLKMLASMMFGPDAIPYQLPLFFTKRHQRI